MFLFLTRTFTLDQMQYFKNTSKDYKMHLSLGTLEMHQVKLIKRRMNVTFQCIFHSLLAGALRELYLAKKIEISESAFIFAPLPCPKHPFKERMTNWM